MRTYQVDGGCLSLRFAVMGPIENNVYLIGDGAGGTIVVDPTAHAQGIVELAGAAEVSAIFVTHRHCDHIGALADLKRLTGAPVFASKIDAKRIEAGQRDEGLHLDVPPCAVDRKLRDGDEFAVGASSWRVLLTPGHTPGGLCYFCQKGDRSGAPLLVSGDTLFRASIGRTDFEGGSMADMRKSLRKLGTLPDSTIVLPGHNQLTSIGDERVRVIEALQR